jgi:hypothetical protein
MSELAAPNARAIPSLCLIMTRSPATNSPIRGTRLFERFRKTWQRGFSSRQKTLNLRLPYGAQ